jgi:hypothetical protein
MTAQERLRFNSILFDEIHFPVRAADIRRRSSSSTPRGQLAHGFGNRHAHPVEPSGRGAGFSHRRR